ncbi:MAG: hypothetical protein QXY39_06190 [Thermofilaceae archaeon]
MEAWVRVKPASSRRLPKYPAETVSVVTRKGKPVGFRFLRATVDAFRLHNAQTANVYVRENKIGIQFLPNPNGDYRLQRIGPNVVLYCRTAIREAARGVDVPRYVMVSSPSAGFLVIELAPPKEV